MDIKVLIWDCETYAELFLVKFYNPDSQEYISFKVSRWENQLDGLFKFLEAHKSYYLVGYNSLSFDAQVLEWIYRNYENWNELSGLEVCAKICQKAQDTIDNSNYEIFPEYREQDLSFKHIDIFRVNHWDNKNFMVSLKRLMFEMNEELIEELPIPFDKKDLTQGDIEVIDKYCTNDLKGTYKGWLHTIGQTEHPLYKDNNQIELRFAIEAEFGIKCLNFSDAKIGDEIIKKFYCENKGIEYRNLPKKGFFRKSIALKYCIPKTISFKTKQLQEFLTKIKGLELGINDDFEESIEFYGQTYTFMRGGIHNVIKGRIYEATEDLLLKDVDVAGFYPGTIINYSYYPFHLGKEFLIGYETVYNKRLELKPLAKKDKKIKGIVEAYKKATNCPYGKSSDMQSWLYDKQLTLATCITGELSLLMLVESMELEGISCIMLNTDGGSFIVPKDRLSIFNEIKDEWVKKTTGKLSYSLEETDYEKLIFSTVNDYIGIKKGYYEAPEDKKAEFIKKKGDMNTEFLLQQNKSRRIIPLAIEAYYTKGIPVEETIKNHKNIYDFCIRQKSSKDFHYEGIITNKVKKEVKIASTREDLISNSWEPTEIGWIHKDLIEYTYYSFEEALRTENEWRNRPTESVSNRNVYKKLIRYYVSIEGEKLLKIKNEECQTNAAKVSQIEAGDYLMTVCNYLPKDTDPQKVGIDYSYYINKAQDFIDKITLGGKKRKINTDKQQMSLFG